MKYSSLRKRGFAILLGAILAAGGTGMAVSAEYIEEKIAEEEVTESLNDISDIEISDIEYSDNNSFGETKAQPSDASYIEEAQAGQVEEESWELVQDSTGEMEPAWQDVSQGEAAMDMDAVPAEDGEKGQDLTENGDEAANSPDQPGPPVKAITGLIYNELPQMLVEAVGQTAADQTEIDAESAEPDAKLIMYSLDGQSFAEEIPTATNAGEYTVWYKVIDAASQQTVEAGSVTATIEKADVQLIAPTAR